MDGVFSSCRITFYCSKAFYIVAEEIVSIYEWRAWIFQMLIDKKGKTKIGMSTLSALSPSLSINHWRLSSLFLHTTWDMLRPILYYSLLYSIMQAGQRYTVSRELSLSLLVHLDDINTSTSLSRYSCSSISPSVRKANNIWKSNIVIIYQRICCNISICNWYY